MNQGLKGMVSLTILGRPIAKKNSKRILRKRSKPKLVGNKFLPGKQVPFLKSSEAYEAYRNFAVGQILCQHRGKTLSGHLALEVIIRIKGRMRLDYSNALDSVCDILQDARVIEDDIEVEWVCGGKILGAEDWSVHVRVFQAQEAFGKCFVGQILAMRGEDGEKVRAPREEASQWPEKGLDGLDMEKSIARHILGPGETLQRFRKRRT